MVIVEHIRLLLVKNVLLKFNMHSMKYWNVDINFQLQFWDEWWQSINNCTRDIWHQTKIGSKNEKTILKPQSGFWNINHCQMVMIILSIDWFLKMQHTYYKIRNLLSFKQIKLLFYIATIRNFLLLRTKTWQDNNLWYVFCVYSKPTGIRTSLFFEFHF